MTEVCLINFPAPAQVMSDLVEVSCTPGILADWGRTLMIACLEIFLTSLESFCGVGITPQRNVWFVHARSGLNPPVDYLIPLKLLEFFKDNIVEHAIEFSCPEPVCTINHRCLQFIHKTILATLATDWVNLTFDLVKESLEVSSSSQFVSWSVSQLVS